MANLINEAKRMQHLAGILNESQLNELDPKVDAARKEYMKQLDIVGLALSKLDDVGANVGGLFNLDKGAQELHDKFFDIAVPAYNELYKYTSGQTAPKLAEVNVPSDVKALGQAQSTATTVASKAKAINSIQEFPGAFENWFKTLGFQPGKVSKTAIRSAVEKILTNLGYK